MSDLSKFLKRIKPRFTISNLNISFPFGGRQKEGGIKKQGNLRHNPVPAKKERWYSGIVRWLIRLLQKL